MLRICSIRSSWSTGKAELPFTCKRIEFWVPERRRNFCSQPRESSTISESSRFIDRESSFLYHAHRYRQALWSNKWKNSDTPLSTAGCFALHFFQTHVGPPPLKYSEIWDLSYLISPACDCSSQTCQQLAVNFHLYPRSVGLRRFGQVPGDDGPLTLSGEGHWLTLSCEVSGWRVSVRESLAPLKKEWQGAFWWASNL